MVTEQVKRMKARLREAGFKRGDFTVRAEIARKRDRSTGLRYSEYGEALGTSRGRRVVEECVEHGGAQRIAEAGLVVEIIGGTLASGTEITPFIAVREPRYRRATGDYEPGRVIERDLGAEIAESEQLRAAHGRV